MVWYIDYFMMVIGVVYRPEVCDDLQNFCTSRLVCHTAWETLTFVTNRVEGDPLVSMLVGLRWVTLVGGGLFYADTQVKRFRIGNLNWSALLSRALVVLRIIEWILNSVLVSAIILAVTVSLKTREERCSSCWCWSLEFDWDGPWFDPSPSW